jgi:tropomyosin
VLYYNNKYSIPPPKIFIFLSYSFTEADLKAENAERTVTQLEQNLADQEAKYEDLFEKHKVLMAEAEEMNRQIDDF